MMGMTQSWRRKRRRRAKKEVLSAARMLKTKTMTRRMKMMSESFIILT